MTLEPTITSRTNARVKKLRASFSGVAAKPGDVVGLEGSVLIGEARRAGLLFETVYLREGCYEALSEMEKGRSDPVVLSRDVFDGAVGAVSPQGIAATVVIPQLTVASEGSVLLLEDLQDPGNLGTLLRSAEAFGVSGVFVTAKTVNAWNPKAMRASAGSVFRVPVMRCALAEMKLFVEARGIKVFAAVAKGDDAIAVMDAELAGNCALLVGNEGAGLSAAALAMCDARVHIPCAIESLNAATAGTTLMYEAMRQRRRQKLVAETER